MTTNGAHKWRVTYHKGLDDHASWARIKGITWHSDRGPHPSSIGPKIDIYRKTIFGPGIERLTVKGNNTHPDWERGRIAWVKDVPVVPGQLPSTSIYHMKADGSDWQGPFGLNHALHTDPVWSPDREKIVFSACKVKKPYRWDLYIMDADGSHVKNLTKHLAPPNDKNTPIIFTEPVYSQDGNKLAFASNYEGNWDIYYWDYRTNSALPIQVTFKKSIERHPTWSPDGKWMAFSSNRYGNNFEIYKLKLPNPNDPFMIPPQRLTWCPYPDINPDWSPKLFDIEPIPGPPPEPAPPPKD
jgi:hypothetical protein